MQVYVVRHGQSQENLTQIYSDGTSPLTKEGEKQAKFVSERFKSIPIDKIFASDMERAKQTAALIAKIVKKDVTHTDLIREMSGPTKIRGLRVDDPIALEIFKKIDDNFHNKEYRHSDEDTFEMLKVRVTRFMHSLEKESAENIAVVAHGYSIRCMVGYVLFGSQFSSHEFTRLCDRLITNNTGITLLEFKNDKWFLRTWNDHAHLAD